MVVVAKTPRGKKTRVFELVSWVELGWVEQLRSSRAASVTLLAPIPNMVPRELSLSSPLLSTVSSQGKVH
jgi:hypothetical protein